MRPFQGHPLEDCLSQIKITKIMKSFCFVKQLPILLANFREACD